MIMISKTLCVAVLLSTFAVACDSAKSGGDPAGSGSAAPGAAAKPAGAAADAPCDAVVAKLASYDPSSGEPEKKLWSKMCEGMPPAMRACIVASKTKEERDACGKDQPLK
jgi:hypothetical protein